MGRKKASPAKASLLNFNFQEGVVQKKKGTNEKVESKAIIYCRVSDKQQVTDGHGLEGQEGVCIEWCNNQSPPIKVEAVFKEPGVSGSVTNRKEFTNAINYLQKENKKFTKITHFVVSEASRISRSDNIVEAFTLEEQIKSLGTKIIKVDSSGIDESTDEGNLFQTIQYAVAGYERKKILKRALNGKRNRLLNGFRPHCKPPVGYLRERISKRDYQDYIDPIKGPLIKEGLELFAQDALTTQVQLWDFWNKKGLRTNHKDAKKLWKTFPAKVLTLNRLFYYAGFIIYPELDINEPVDAQHEGLISLKTLNLLLKKLKKNCSLREKTTIKSLKMSDEHPLRGVITCPGCNRRFTSWNTTKLVGKGEHKVKKLYPYYGCNYGECPQRVYIKKHELEEEFSQLIASLNLPHGVFDLLHGVLDEKMEFVKNNFELIRSAKQKEIDDKKLRLGKLEKAILKTNNVKLQLKYEEERATLNSEIEVLESNMVEKGIHVKRLKGILDKTKALFESPKEIRDLGNPSLREMLLNLWFGDQLHYSKERGLRTGSDKCLYKLYCSLKKNNTILREAWFTNKTNCSNFIDHLIMILREYANTIESIHYNLEYYGILKSIPKSSKA